MRRSRADERRLHAVTHSLGCSLPEGVRFFRRERMPLIVMLPFVAIRLIVHIMDVRIQMLDHIERFPVTLFVASLQRPQQVIHNLQSAVTVRLGDFCEQRSLLRVCVRV